MSIKTRVKKITNALHHTLSDCPLCNSPYDIASIKSGLPFCTACKDKIEESLIKNDKNAERGVVIMYKKYPVYSLFKYELKARDALNYFKSEGNINASEFFSNYLNRWLSNHIFRDDNTIIVPLPSSKSGLKKRGFDQCIEVLRGTDVPFFNLFELAKRSTSEQKRLSSKDRRKEASGKFRLVDDATNIINNAENIIVFDDVITTGSSIRECIKLLTELKVKANIIGLTLYSEDLLLQ